MTALRALAIGGLLANVLVGCATKSAASDSTSAMLDSTSATPAPALAPDSAGGVAAHIDSAPTSVPATAGTPAANTAAKTTSTKATSTKSTGTKSTSSTSATTLPTTRAPGATIGRDSAYEIPKGGPVHTLPEVKPKTPR